MVPIYHFTHWSNLLPILTGGGLDCDRVCRSLSLTQRSIGYSDLKDKRLNTDVEVFPGGKIGDYVPFYFGTRSPMLYAYKNGRVTGQRENQDEIIYLVTWAEAVASRGYRFVFTDGHPVREPKAFFNDLQYISEVDLPLMDATWWNDTPSDPDRSRRRQAEFLVHQRITWEHIDAIGVRTQAVHDWVFATLSNSLHKPPCIIKPTWYYE